MNWIAEAASEHASIPANIANAAGVGAIAIYNHGSHTDNHWHAGTIDSILDNVKAIHDQDFQATCPKSSSIWKKRAGIQPQEYFDTDDPARMAAVIRAASKPCIVYKILAAGRKCDTPQAVVDAFHYAYDNIKPTDIVNVGMFQKYRNQVKENVEIVRAHLACQ
ncbi:MAG: hypothetical protein ABFD54_01810 [Armatimonadota bacterium]|nr:hypothetical protein [bacterium]